MEPGATRCTSSRLAVSYSNSDIAQTVHEPPDAAIQDATIQTREVDNQKRKDNTRTGFDNKDNWPNPKIEISLPRTRGLSNPYSTAPKVGFFLSWPWPRAVCPPSSLHRHNYRALYFLALDAPLALSSNAAAPKKPARIDRLAYAPPTSV